MDQFHQKKYRCRYCLRAFNCRKQIYYHSFCAKDKRKPFTCPICLKGFVTRAHFQYHAKRHAGIKDFGCKACGAAFSRAFDLKRHSRTHDPPAYVCEKCPRQFRTLKAHENHRSTHETTRQEQVRPWKKMKAEIVTHSCSSFESCEKAQVLCNCCMDMSPEGTVTVSTQTNEAEASLATVVLPK